MCVYIYIYIGSGSPRATAAATSSSASVPSTTEAAAATAPTPMQALETVTTMAPAEGPGSAAGEAIGATQVSALFCKELLCLNTVPCRHTLLLVHFWEAGLADGPPPAAGAEGPVEDRAACFTYGFYHHFNILHIIHL